jgi:hypothetical protein
MHYNNDDNNEHNGDKLIYIYKIYKSLYIPLKNKYRLHFYDLHPKYSIFIRIESSH